MAIGRIPEPGTGIPESIIAAKGDLIVGTANDTPGILSVGTNGYTLVADSSVSPQGLKWAVDPVADVVTTAGDLIYGTAADTVARLGIGTAGQVLQVNSGATAPEWATPSAGATFVGVQVYNSATQSAGNAADLYPDFDSESWDTDSFHSTTTNTSRLTVPSGQGGKYFVYAVGGYSGNTTGYRRFCFSVNRTFELFNNFITPDTGSCVITFSGVLDLVATDYVEILTYQNSGGSLNYLGSANYSSFGMYKIG